ncbi:MAG: nucleoside-diphosphate-sugar epimerase [Verrucomicrobiales bacterium]|jgi:nucleoside-diphosphate-sugar epimerase
MKVVVTGAAGFIGKRLVRRILERGELTLADGSPVEVTSVLATDIVAPAVPIADDPRLTFVAGDFGQEQMLDLLVTADTQVVFHLAAVVSGGAEEDFDLGMRVNLHSTMAMLERLRALPHTPRMVFASSVAVFGGQLPDVIEDGTACTPQTSYGGQKLITEHLLNDYSRRGYLDGRALRLPTIVVRPGKPNKAASSFASAIIREPLQGKSVVCPIGEVAGVWVLSPRMVVENFLRAAELPADAWGTSRSVSLPGLTIRVKEMIDTLRDVAGEAVAARIQWQSDAEIERIVYGWPVQFKPERALAMGFAADAGFREIVEAFIEDELNGTFVE